MRLAVESRVHVFTGRAPPGRQWPAMAAERRSLNQRDRRLLTRFQRQVAHLERTHLAGMERVLAAVPPRLAPDAERVLSLEPGALTTWLIERQRGNVTPVPLAVPACWIFAAVEVE